MLGVAAAVSLLAACSSSATAARNAAPASATRPPPAARTHAPSAAVSVLTDTAAGDLTARFAQALFASAPVVVVAGTSGGALPAPAAVAAARAAHAPLLLAARVTASGTTGSGSTGQLAAQVRVFHPAAVLTAGLSPGQARDLTARLRGVRVTGRVAELPPAGAPAPLSQVAVLVSSTGTGTGTGARAVQTAVTATAKAAGATVIGMSGTDPRTNPKAIAELARLRPETVVAVGTAFGPVARLASRLAVAETGRQLPGGGQVLFPGRRLVALYGHPGTPGLGVLGQQDLAAGIARARTTAAAYQPLSTVPVVPAFEIIATVAEASPGPDGSYSYETPVADLLPWVRRATAAGLYVVLDLQPGRAGLLAQAEHYQSLLELPDVGLALDPEWKLQPGQKPLRQIGHVDIGEVNGVIGWLAALTDRYHLPQKLLVLHQFQLSMLAGEQHLDTGRDDLSIVIHMDGQGTPALKQDTWNAVTAAAPPGVFFGWKNFLVKDHPMLTPGQTMTKTPAPVMISYQ